MPTSLLSERRQLGPVQQLAIEAGSLAAAHRQLGQQLGPVIRRVAKQRLQATPAADFDLQIAGVRSCLTRIELRVQSQLTRPALREGLAEYRECLRAWLEGSELAVVVGKAAAGGQRVSAEELALWLQDDNSGCQTGLVRLPGGDVLFWHTEEDTIGYFDRPRLAAFTVRGQTWHAFLYPYLLPGPAFGWQAGWFHAVDSLQFRRSEHGTLTAVVAWLAWRSGRLVFDDLIALCPFIDACAIHGVACTPSGVSASVQELGWLDVRQRKLGTRAGHLVFQANCVNQQPSRLARREALAPSERQRYCERGERAKAAIARLFAAKELTPQRIVELLAARAGGGYANANADVKAHCVGVARAGGLELYVESGAALSGDQYQPQFHA